MTSNTSLILATYELSLVYLLGSQEGAAVLVVVTTSLLWSATTCSRGHLVSLGVLCEVEVEQAVSVLLGNILIVFQGNSIVPLEVSEIPGSIAYR